MPEPLKPVIVPPTAVISAAEKSVADSLSVKVMVAFSPILRADLLLTIEIVGATVSMVIGVASDPATLALPNTSVKVLAATEIAPEAVELAAGVNVAM